MFGATRSRSAVSNTSVGTDRPTKLNVGSVLSAARRCSGSPQLKAISSRRLRWVYLMARPDCISPNTHLLGTAVTTTRSQTVYRRATATDHSLFDEHGWQSSRSDGSVRFQRFAEWVHPGRLGAGEANKFGRHRRRTYERTAGPRSNLRSKSASFTDQDCTRLAMYKRAPASQ
jgi:hypothetical protein